MTTHALPIPVRRPAVLVLAIGAFVLGAVAVAWLDSLDGAGHGDPAGPALSVRQALAVSGERRVLIDGLVFVARDGTVYLADTLAESYPPQLASDDALRVEGLDLAAVDGLVTAGGVSWTDRSLTVPGRLAGGVLATSSLHG